jgi:hypothetical protein
LRALESIQSDLKKLLDIISPKNHYGIFLIVLPRVTGKRRLDCVSSTVGQNLLREAKTLVTS